MFSILRLGIIWVRAESILLKFNYCRGVIMPQQTLRTDNEGRIAIVVMCDGGKAAERESFVINLKGWGGVA